MSRRAKWADLAPRVMTAAVLLAIGLAEVWAGGWVFALGILALCGLMIWELSRMLAPGAEGRALGLAALGVLALGLGWLLLLGQGVREHATRPRRARLALKPKNARRRRA